MKKIGVIFLFIFYCKLSLYAQIVDCNKLADGLSNKSTFEDINSSFNKYLSSNNFIFQDTVLMNKVGNCWYDLIKSKKEFKSYSIRESDLKMYPGLVFLVLNSNSMDSQEEKQGWFNLLPLMTSIQIDKLWDILQREAVKLSEIEAKYEKKKLEIKEAYLNGWKKQEQKYFNKMNEGFFAISVDTIANPKISFWYKENQLYKSPFLNTTSKKLVFLKPNNIDSIIQKYPSINSYELTGRFNEFKNDLRDFLLGSSTEELKGFKNIDYLSYYWEFFIDDMQNKPSEISYLERLLALNFDDYVLNERKDALKRNRLFSLYYVNNQLGNYCKSCQYRIEGCYNNVYTLKSPQRFLMSFYSFVVFEQDSTCKQCHEDLATYYVKQYELNKEYIINNFVNFVNFETHYLLTDFIINYSSNTKIIEITKELKSLFIENSILSNINAFSEDNQKWYYNLNNLYINGSFLELKDIDQLYSESNILAKNSGILKFDDIEAARMEYLYYYAQYQIIFNNNLVKSNVLQILKEVKRLGENPSLKTFNYVEKDLAKILLNIMEKAKIDKNPPILSINEIPVNVTDSIINISGLIADESEIKFLKVNSYSVIINENGMFRYNYVLKKGNNILNFTAEDNKGNQVTKNFNVTYTPQIDPLLTRKDYAIIITFDSFMEGANWSKLNNTKKDGQDIGKLLTDYYGFEVEYRHNLTKREFNQFIYTRISERQFGEYDQLFIFISGHGDRDNNCLGYLVMSDSDDPRNDFTHETYVSYADLTSKLKASKCKHILLVVDACHSGTIDEQIAFLTKGESDFKEQKDLIIKSLQYPTRFFLTSGGQEEVSDGQPGTNSPFAKEIIKALNTKGGNDKILTLTEIQTVLGTEKREHLKVVKSSTKKQCTEEIVGPRWGDFAKNVPGTNFIFIYKEKQK